MAGHLCVGGRRSWLLARSCSCIGSIRGNFFPEDCVPRKTAALRVIAPCRCSHRGSCQAFRLTLDIEPRMTGMRCEGEGRRSDYRSAAKTGMVRSLASAMVVAVGASPAFADAVPSFGMFTSYQTARKSLLSQGWLPWRLPNANSCSPQDDRCRGRPEMLNCDAGGSATCVFTWKKGQQVIEVTTRGKGSGPGVTGVKCQSGCGSP